MADKLNPGISGTANRRGIPKSAPIFTTLGTLEELDSALALAGTQLGGQAAEITEALRREVKALYSELCGGKRFADAGRVQGLAASRELLQSAAGQGGETDSPAAATLRLARAIARRAERALVAQKASGGVTPEALRYLDALSDTLEALAAFAAAQGGQAASGTGKAPVEAGAPAVSTVANAQLPHSGFLQQGLWLCQTVLQEARRRDMRVVCAACDSGGNLTSLLRDDAAYVASVAIATDKAWTSVSLQMPTEALETLAAPGGELYGIQHTNGGRVVIFAGGIPLSQNGVLVGGFGVSGGTAAQDKALAHFAAAAWAKRPE